MSYHRMHILIIALHLGLEIPGQCQSSFQIHYATSGSDLVRAVDNDAYGNTIVVGSTRMEDAPSYGLIMKINPNGSYTTTNMVSPDTILTFYSIKVLPSGSYFILGGKFWDNNGLDGQMMVLIMDTAMNILSSKYYDMPAPYIWNGGNGCMIEDNDGNLVVAETLLYYENNIERTDFVFYKFNPQGDTLACRIIHTLFDAIPYCLRTVPNSDNFMLISHGYIPFAGQELIFLDSSLNLLKVNRIHSMAIGYFDSKYWLSDTTFLMVQNFIRSTDTTSEYMFQVYKLDTSATYYEGISFDHSDTIEYVSQIEGMACFDDTTIYISGHQSYNSFLTTTPIKVFLYLIDKDLNIRGYKVLGGDNYYYSNGVYATTDGGCIVWALRADIPYTGNRWDIQIWKVMPEDMFLYTKVETLPYEIAHARAWPNPARDHLYIGIDGFKPYENIRFRVFAINGQKYLDQKLIVSGNTIHSNIRNLDAGCYIYEIENSFGRKSTGKFIKN